MKMSGGKGRARLPSLWLAAVLFAGCQATKPAKIATTMATTMPARSLDQIIKGFEVDDRMNLFDVWQKPDGKLAGYVEMPQYRSVLKASGFDVSDVKLLPEESNSPYRFGIVRAPHALLRKYPKDQPGDRDNATDVRRGELVWILDQHDDGATLVHASDGYLGWVDGDAIDVVNETRFKAGAATRPASALADARMSAIDRETEEGKSVINAITREGVLADAQLMLGTRYVWGGKTKEGIDCSGLAQTSFARHGILLPRDADQQANVGRLVATRWFKDALLPGDLLFFVSNHRGNVNHVAIYMGDGRYIEAAGKDVHISSLSPGDEAYDKQRADSFGWARRVIE